MTSIETPFAIGARVHADGALDITMTVTAVLVRPHGVELELSWLHNGALQRSWFESFRISGAAR